MAIGASPLFVKMSNYTFAVKKLEHLYLNSDLSTVNFIFKTGDEVEKVPAQKCILATDSEVFRAMFFGPMKSEGDIVITDVTAGSFKEFLRYFYFSDLKCTVENVAEVTYLADYYHVPDCVNKCIQFFKSFLMPENVCSVYPIAITINNEVLKAKCDMKVSMFTDDVFESESFLQCDPVLLERILKMDQMSCHETNVFDACIEWAKVNCNEKGIDLNPRNLKAALGDCFKLIRFGAMKLEEFSRCASLYQDMFTRDELAAIIFSRTSTTRSSMFNGSPRSKPFSWNRSQVFLCSRFKDRMCRYHIHESESVWFSVNVPVILSKIECPAVFVQPDSMQSKVTIFEVLNGERKRTVQTITAVLTNNPLGVVRFDQTIFINPRKVYEICFEQSIHNRDQVPHHEFIWHLSEVRINHRLVVNFHSKPADRYPEFRGLVQNLYFCGLNDWE